MEGERRGGKQRKDEDGEGGDEEMDRREEGGLNHPPLCQKASPPITCLCRKTTAFNLKAKEEAELTRWLPCVGMD